MNQKQCSGCKEIKEKDKFFKLSSKPDGLDYYCKECRHKSHSKSLLNTKKVCSIKGCNKKYYAKEYCKTHYMRKSRNGTVESKYETYRSDKVYRSGAKAESLMESRLKNKYGLTLKEFKERSKNGCEICHQQPEYTLHVDHDHSCCSGYKTCGVCVRGIICPSCNKAVADYEKGTLSEHYHKRKLIQQYVNYYGRIERSQ